ncbi:MAG: YHYH domain-containing protein [Chloroflexi bacterium]|nr:YHYH domain-containing protein [Chloroflexota bacterium]MCY3937491.1 YHYH domain-containing protein [Chloroflexota bacterium]
MTRSTIRILAVAVLLPLTLAVASDHARAHGGGLNTMGCHTNHATGEYHCHQPPRLTECATQASIGPSGARMYFSPEITDGGYWWSAPEGAGLRLTGGETRGWCEVVNGGWVQLSDLRVVTVATTFQTPPLWRPHIVTTVTTTPTPAPHAAPYCAPGQEPEFMFGFAFLRSLLGDVMGDPLECEHANPENGDTLQQTTTGLSFYRKSTNTPTFTDGWNHWAWTTHGLVTWTGDAIDPPRR